LIPFAAIGYGDRIRIQRVGYDPNPSGKTRLIYPTAAEDEVMASVQSERVERPDDATGQIRVVTRHRIFTPTDPHTKPNDKIIWTDKHGTTRNLIAKGGSMPRGIGDVLYETETVETVV
jgi:hypothetical protein